MRRTLQFVTVLVAALCALPLLGDNGTGGADSAKFGGKISQHERRVKGLSPVDRRRLDSLSLMSRESLRRIDQATQAQKIRAQTEEILAQGSLCIGAREYDEQGRAPIHRYLLDRLGKMEGVEVLGSLKGRIAVPVKLSDEPETADRLSQVTVEGQAYPAEPMWPNGAMPSLVPADGLKGRLVFVNRAEWQDLKGLDLSDSIALVNFEAGRNWARLLNLGCQAAIVIADSHIVREKAEGWFCNTPVPFPRFYVDAQTGAKLIDQATRKVYTSTDTSEFRVVGGKRATLTGGNLYANRPWEAIFAYLPPTEPVVYTVPEADLLDRIALAYGTGRAELIEVNNLNSPRLTKGRKLRIPNSTLTYVVKDADLLSRIAADYGVTLDEIKSANANLDPNSLSAGDAIQVPNVPQPLSLMVPIDSVSVVPGAPHGGKIASNIAMVLATLDHLSTSANVVRRKGLLVGFLDGESMGGIASRTFGEAVMLSRGTLEAVRGEDALTKINWYKQGLQWVQDPQKVQLDESGWNWFGEQWLRAKVEQRRVHYAEQASKINRRRSDLAKELTELREQLPTVEGEQRQRLKGTIQRTEQIIERLRERTSEQEKLRDLVVEIRRQSLDGWDSWKDKAVRLHGVLQKSAEDGKAQQVGLTLQDLQEQLREEVDELELAYNLQENNQDTVTKLLAKLSPPGVNTPSLGWQLDLTDGSHSISVKPELRISKGNNAKHQRFKDVLSYASVSAPKEGPQSRWNTEWLVLEDIDSADYPVSPDIKAATYSEFWTLGQLSVNVLGTKNDTFPLLDTPRDVPANMDFRNLGIIARNVMLLIRVGLENPVDSLPPGKIKPLRFGRLVGKVTRFNIRSGINAQDPVPGTYVYMPGRMKTEPDDNSKNTAKYMGSRKGIVRIARLNGTYEMPLECISVKTKDVLYAYRLNKETGLFDMVVDEGQIGTRKASPDYKLSADKDEEKKLVMTQVYPLVFAPGVDPMNYSELDSTRGGNTLSIIDVIMEGEPQHYGLDSPNKSYGETNIDANIVYMPPGRRVRIVAHKNNDPRMLLVGPINEDYPKGSGYRVGPIREDEDELSFDRNVFLRFPALQIALRMRDLADNRRRIYEEHGITDQSVVVALERVEEKVEQARQAHEQKDWRASNGASREAWGMLVKNYPRVLTLGREAVFSAVVLMGLLLPASLFLEKLVIGGRGIVARLIGTTIIFALGTVFMNYFHPAFMISVSPFIVVIAFTMILMSVVVLTLMYQRFDVLVRRARAAGGEVESEEISLLASLGTALSMGVSNLKKRPARTVLTVFTVTVLTFSIITFVSVSGKDSLSEQDVTLDPELEGGRVDPTEPMYRGVMFREYYWVPLKDNFVSALRAEYGASYPMAIRGNYVQTRGGNNEDREGINQLEVRSGKKLDILTAIMTFEPSETEFSHLHQAVSNQQWFRPEDRAAGRPADRDVVILPDRSARKLGVAAHQLYQPMVYEAQADLNQSPEGTVLVADHSQRVVRRVSEAQADQDPQLERLDLEDLLKINTGRDTKRGQALWLPNRRTFPKDITLEQLELRAALPLATLAKYAELPSHENVSPANIRLLEDVEVVLPRLELKPHDQLPLISLKNRPWRLVGVLDVAYANRIRDVNGKSLAIVDYLRSAFSPNASAGETELTNESQSYHRNWTELAIIPHAAAADVESEPASVAIRFTPEMPDEQIEQFRRDVALRLNRNMFANFGNGLVLVSTETESSVGGLAKVVVPVILCVLIVLNTMMANVEERKGEVGMLGAIGLSPGQISFLLLSESLVFSVLGIVLGVFAGLLFANLIPVLNEAYPGFLEGLSVNFTSLSSMGLAMGTGLVVLLATIIPARKASALAAPSGMASWELPEPTPDRRIMFDLPFTLTRGNAVGMFAFFRQFLENHTDAASQNFNCRNIVHQLKDVDEDALVLTTDMWLAPYDLDVAQQLNMKVIPTENVGVFKVHITLHRTSGTEEAWMRTNYGFMDLVRHQFLLWRNLDDQARRSYVERGVDLFQTVSA